MKSVTCLALVDVVTSGLAGKHRSSGSWSSLAEKPSEMLPKKKKANNMKIGSCRCTEGCSDGNGGVRWLPGVTQVSR